LLDSESPFRPEMIRRLANDAKLHSKARRES
jgi:hypothetical protein